MFCSVILIHKYLQFISFVKNDINVQFLNIARITSSMMRFFTECQSFDFQIE